MGLTFGIGFIFVPIFSIAATKIGGDLAPLLVSAALCVLPSIVLETCIERKSYEHDISVDESNGPAPQINITNVVRILQKPGVLNVMAKKNGGVISFLMIIAVLNGIVLGTATSLNSLVRTFSPLFAGSLLQNYGFQSLTLLGVFGSLLAIGLMIVSPVDENLIKKHKTE
ncbi:hypothetical protein CAEBREN_06675 [Caenorhabditis brenneri]|uniref:Uncharacterized protein n=1 Tax=Caenorhabditis brenneri TaxID=135651 RepID=G0NZA8_CAEBE|nr:hypothetical protein CAEBREN_06675 [Caenorhabditis brenneri]